MELDHFDRQLLNIVQEDSGQTADQLAKQVPLSASAIQRRLRRLLEEGVISRYVAILDPAKVGRSTLFVVSVQVERERPELLAQFRTWLATEAHVQQALYVTGEADFVLVISAPDTETYDRFVSRMVSENPNVKRFTTNVSLSVIKMGLTIPVAPIPGAE
jgi:Lrp/AsnC family transcriptional regulator, leucine-responsive regulatory protein